jgi:O-antigen ligase
MLLASFYLHPVGWAAAGLLLCLAVFSAAFPPEGLLVYAAAAPLSTILAVLADAHIDGARFVEALTLAFLAGWATHRVLRPVKLVGSQALRWCCAALAVLAFASAVVSGSIVLAELGGHAPLVALDDWLRSYARTSDGVNAGMLFAEGVLLVLATTEVCGQNGERREAVLRMLVIGAAAAGSFNLLRIIIDGALRHEHAWQEFVRLFLHLRVNVHHGDLNAAGSYFALMFFPAVAFATRSRRAGTLILIVISAALWMTGSRVALAATAIVGVALLAAKVPAARKHTRAAIALGVLIVAAVAIAWPMLPDRHVADPWLALRIRMGLAAGALAMASDHPVFGVGAGHFYELSALYVHVPNYILRENAHNNFLQILAELGTLGLCLFATVLGLALSAARPGSRAGATPITAGLIAFLLTCLGGHPLLIPHVAMPFWISVGVAASWSTHEPHRGWKTLAAVVAAVVIIAMPWRVQHAMRGANLNNATSGLSDWRRGDNGERYRWAEARATFYVRSSARAVTIPLRLPSAARNEVQVRVFLNGTEANRVTLHPVETWSNVRLVLVQHGDEQSFARIDLEAVRPSTQETIEVPTDRDGLLLVGVLHIE